MSQWKYQRNDAGIPGLPHVITDEEAAERGLTDQLQSAIESGAYAVAMNSDRFKPSRIGKVVKKESEVNDGQ